jgi:hypothetical protein
VFADSVGSDEEEFEEMCLYADTNRAGVMLFLYGFVGTNRARVVSSVQLLQQRMTHPLILYLDPTNDTIPNAFA